MSDCLNLAIPGDNVNPGCPESSARARRRIIEGADADVDLIPRDLSDAPRRLREDLLWEGSPWLQAVRFALGAPPEAPWPPFAVAPPANPVERNSVSVVWPVPPGALVPVLWEGAAPAGAAAASAGGRGVAALEGGVAIVATVVAAAVAVAVVAGVWAVLAVRRQDSRPLPESQPVAATNALKAWRLFWMSDALDSTAVRPPLHLSHAYACVCMHMCVECGAPPPHLSHVFRMPMSSTTGFIRRCCVRACRVTATQ